MPITLPERSDLDNIFGSKNISAWADVENAEEDELIEARVTWAITNASNYILAKLARKYKVTDWLVFPAIIFDLVARRAGVELYRTPRGITDGAEMSQAMLAIDADLENKLNLVLAGGLVLIDLVETQPTNAPMVVNHISRRQKRDFGIDVDVIDTDDLPWIETES
jgi:hypothetical protein